MPHLLLVRNRYSEVEVKMEKTLSCECYNPRIVIQGEGKETSTRYFPESTLLAKASKVNIQNSFPTSLEISGLGVRKLHVALCLWERALLFSCKCSFARCSLGTRVTSCPPPTANRTGLPGLQLQALSMAVLASVQSQIDHQ